ncbi:MAG: acyltransferase [Betaproteobacteria bacterium]
MRSSTSEVVKGALAATTLALNTIVHGTLLVPFALAKLLVPVAWMRRLVDPAMNALAGDWMRVNAAWMAAVGRTRWDVAGDLDLHARGWYLVSSNHRSWVDILALQKVFNGRIPMLKFFLKQELIWVPVIGLAWWALDFPFLKRGKGGASAQVDLETTRRACERFKLIPTSVISFAEGTRFTPAKHNTQGSPYAHLLKPKSGGLAVALAAMGPQFEALLDITLYYPGRTPTFWDLLCGRVPAVVVRVQKRPIPAELTDPATQSESGFRGQVQRWIDGIWVEKDELLAQFTRQAESAGTGG